MPQDYFGRDIQEGDFIHWFALGSNRIGKSPGGRDGIVTRVTKGTVQALTIAEKRDIRYRSPEVEGGISAVGRLPW